MRPALALLLFVAGLAPGLRAGDFLLPSVDVVPDTVSQTASIAVWSYTKVSLSPGANIKILFPPDATMPPMTPSFGTCRCLAMKYSQVSSGPAKSFADEELDITSASLDLSNRILTVPIPDTDPSTVSAKGIDVGKFYIRVRTTFGIKNPLNYGLATLGLVDPQGVTITSKAYFISPSTSDSMDYAGIKGTVTYSGSSKVASGVLVMATTDATHPSSNVGPSTTTPRGVSSHAITTATGPDGTYRMLLPVGSWNILATASRVTVTSAGQVTQTVSSSAASAGSTTVLGTAELTVNISLPSFP